MSGSLDKGHQLPGRGKKNKTPAQKKKRNLVVEKNLGGVPPIFIKGGFFSIHEKRKGVKISGESTDFKTEKRLPKLIRSEKSNYL